MPHALISSPLVLTLRAQMFEHMKNYKALMAKVASWLRPDGPEDALFFVHIFCHRTTPYHFEEGDGWMAQTFFSGSCSTGLSYLYAYNHSTCAYRGYYAIARPSSEQCTPRVLNAIVEVDLCGPRSYTSRMTSLTSGAGSSTASTTRRRRSIGSRPKTRTRRLVSQNLRRTRLRKAWTRRKAGRHSIGSYYRMFHCHPRS